MKKVAIFALALALAAPASAQVFDQSTPSNRVEMELGELSSYKVKAEDNLWKLAELKRNNPEDWRWLVDQNPFLKAPGRQFTKSDGTFVVLIRPGETLRGLEEVGINPQSSAPVTPKTPLIADVKTKSFFEKLGVWMGDNWWWVALLLGLIGLIAWLFRRELHKDPVSSGPAMVEGGVNNGSIHRHFEQRCSKNGLTLVAGSIVSGRGYGRMMVSYRGGEEHLRILNGEAMYRARAQDEDGEEKDIYMLQACGNDVTYGGRVYRLLANFRFVEGEAVAEPSAEPVAEPEDVLQLDTPAPIGDEAEGTADAAKPFHFSFTAPRTRGDNSLLRVGGKIPKGFQFDLKDGTFSIRF